eukprot:TRINITY_DN4267_c0_g1_i1.p1 TRINITY_DN4267_c0_g1~~TRINITY_DN4267_c0_g1_i1.p1  ORF type:complete len:1813 (+),score=366.76 TRINITY_DN4267_c0_g1_i1:45-5441(+)
MTRRVNAMTRELMGAGQDIYDVPIDIRHPILDNPWADGMVNWLRKKDEMGQDVYLVGGYGPIRRWLCLRYCSAAGRGISYVALTRDTTESDLKQRKEITTGGSVVFSDLPAVEAAIKGRILVMEGIENAERNVLPVINNLLENREMSLEDGRMLIAPQRFDSLVASGKHTKEELQKRGIVRVHPNFRVFALGVPCPPYAGSPLDPPLRSRFQSIHVGVVPLREWIAAARQFSPSTKNIQTIARFLAVITELTSKMHSAATLPPPSGVSLLSAVKQLQLFPNASIEHILWRAYPWSLLCRSKDSFEMMQQSLEASDIRSAGTDPSVAAMVASLFAADSTPMFGNQQHAMASMLQSHQANRDICLIAPKGEGKTFITQQFAIITNYNEVESIFLYADMSARELLQRRVLGPKGETTWETSPLVNAAESGKLAILDGLQRLSAGTYGALSRLIQDREITLFDGTRYITADAYDRLINSGVKPSSKIRRIHPNFRIVALGTPPGTGGDNYLVTDLQHMFDFHELPKYLTDDNSVTPLHKFALKTQVRAEDPTNTIPVLSLRQLRRIERQASYNPSRLTSACRMCILYELMPQEQRTTVDLLMKDSGLPVASTIDHIPRNISINLSDENIKVGTTNIKRMTHGTRPELVPEIHFVDIPSQIAVMEHMIQDLIIGEHLLLIGNQGVGKNKLTDRLLQLLHWEREYTQLHRDTTVSQLTLQPTLSNGLMVWEDSPLVRSMQHGRCLVIDEMDKAPGDVICVIKGLLEDGEIRLADGRLFRSKKHPKYQSTNKSEQVHPLFRVIALANRPGYPFMGNDCYAEVGDIFASHVVGNPDPGSELKLLEAVAPSVSSTILTKVAKSFAELRKMSDSGDISYPYSTREAVAVARHLDKHPTDGITGALSNIIGFDAYDAGMLETLKTVFTDNGLTFSTGSSLSGASSAVSHPVPMRPLAVLMQLFYNHSGNDIEQVGNPVVKILPSTTLQSISSNIKTVTARQSIFTEEVEGIQLPDISAYSQLNIVPGKHTEGSLHVVGVDNRRGTVICTVDIKREMTRTVTLPPSPCLKPRSILLDSGYIFLWNGTTVTLISESTPATLQQAEVQISSTDSVALLALDDSSVLLVGPSKIVCLKTDCWESKNSLSGWCWDLLFDISSAYVLLKDRIQIRRKGEDTQYHIQVGPMMKVPSSKITLTVGGSHAGYSVAGEIFSAYDEKNKDVMKPPELPDIDQMTTALNQNVITPVNMIAKSSVSCVGIQMGSSSGIITNDVDIKDGKESWSQTVFCYPSRTEINDSPHVNATWLGICNLMATSLPPNSRGVSTLELTDIKEGTQRRILIGERPGSAWDMTTVSAPKEIREIAQLSDGRVALLMDGAEVRVLEIRKEVLTNEERRWAQREKKEASASASPDNIVDDGKEAEPGNGLGEGNGAGDGNGNGEGSGEGSGDGEGGGGGQGGDSPTMGSGGPDANYESNPGKQKEGSSELVVDEKLSFTSSSQKNSTKDDALAASLSAEAKQRALEIASKKLVSGSDRPNLANLDAGAYHRLCEAVGQEIKSLRGLLETVEAKEKERIWLKNQMAGDLDDGRIVDGITGEKTIFRKRSTNKPPPGAMQRKPKRLLFAFDCSASMARFDPEDRRLARSAAVAVLIMEGFAAFPHKYDYSIIGHNGDTPCIEIVPFGNHPRTELERFEVVKAIYGGTSCKTGDNTLGAAKYAIDKVVEESGDDYFVVLLSDANVSQYGIDAKNLSEFLMSDPRVTSHVVLIASEHGAVNLAHSLPAGTGHLITDTADLPKVFRKLFEASLLKPDSKL